MQISKHSTVFTACPKAFAAGLAKAKRMIRAFARGGMMPHETLPLPLLERFVHAHPLGANSCPMLGMEPPMQDVYARGGDPVVFRGLCPFSVRALFGQELDFCQVVKVELTAAKLGEA